MSDLPEPLTPADCDLRDFPFMPLDIVRLFNSRFHAIANDAEWRAGVTLWLKSFHQVPAASVADDDIELCRLAELGRDLKAWKKVKAVAMHGWIKCSDGRFYNPTVAEKAVKAWNDKRLQRERTMKATQARRKSSRAENAQRDDDRDVQRDVQRDDDVTFNVTATKREGEGKGDISSSLRSDDSPPASQAPQGARRGTRLPDDWTLTPALIAYAATCGYTEHETRFIAHRFENHWRSATGSKAVKLDWDRTFQNWVTNENRRQVQDGAKAWRNGDAAERSPEQRRAERERIWREQGVWNPKWGARPDEPGYAEQPA